MAQIYATRIKIIAKIWDEMFRDLIKKNSGNNKKSHAFCKKMWQITEEIKYQVIKKYLKNVKKRHVTAIIKWHKEKKLLDNVFTYIIIQQDKKLELNFLQHIESNVPEKKMQPPTKRFSNSKKQEETKAVSIPQIPKFPTMKYIPTPEFIATLIKNTADGKL